jgi:hypothetical protein
MQEQGKKKSNKIFERNVHSNTPNGKRETISEERETNIKELSQQYTAFYVWAT